MSIKDKYRWLALVVAAMFIGAVATCVIIGLRFSIPNSDGPEANGVEIVELPLATGNIGDTVDAFIQEAEEEVAALGDGQEEIDLLFSDNQEISDFSQSIDENDL